MRFITLAGYTGSVVVYIMELLCRGKSSTQNTISYCGACFRKDNPTYAYLAQANRI